MDHINDKLMIKYCDGTLSEKAHRDLSNHISNCNACSEKVKLLKGLEQAAGQRAKNSRNMIPSIKERLYDLQVRPQTKVAKFAFKYRRIALTAFYAVTIILAVIIFWQPLVKGISVVINDRFGRTQVGSQPSVLPTEAPSTAVAIPNPAADRKDAFKLGLFRSTMSYQEVIDLSKETSQTSEKNPASVPYAVIPLDKIVIEEEPFLTDSDIVGFNADTMIITLKKDVYERVSQSLVSALVEPFVVQLDGKRLFWGVFLHPLSSMLPPNSIPRLDFMIEANSNLFRLVNMDNLSESDRNVLIQFFKDQGKLDIIADSQGEAIQEQGDLSLSQAFVINILNLNQPKPYTLALPLPEGWRAIERDYEVSKDFSFKNEKNKYITILQSFTLYFDEQLENTFYWDSKGRVSGELQLQGYYAGEPHGAALPNHSQVLDTVYQGESPLGAATIYLLDCDIPRDLQKENETTFRMYFTVIPIEGEDLAYTLSIPVPQKIKPADYLKYVKDILGISQ